MSTIETLSSGRVQSFITTNGVQRETTQENAEKLKTDIAEIERILNDAEKQVPEEISAPPTPSALA